MAFYARLSALANSDFVRSESEPLGAGCYTFQSKIAIGLGGLYGKAGAMAYRRN